MNLQNSQLIGSLSLLFPEELKPLDRWLQSPWCNSNKKAHQLFLFLKKGYPDFGSANLDGALVFKHLYPTKKYNDRWLRNLMAELNQQVRNFLIHQRLEQDEVLKKILLARTYERRHQTTRLLKLTTQINEELETKKNKDWEDYLHLCLLNDLLYYLPETTNRWQATSQTLQKADANLDQFYLLGKWRYRSEFAERSQTLNGENQELVDLKILEEIGQNHSIPALELYRQKLLENKEMTEAEFVDLQKKYFQEFDNLAFKDQKILYYYLLNMLIRMCLRGKSHLFENLFELYQVGIEKQLIIHFNRMSDKTYTNIVTLGNSLQQSGYVQSFIEEQTILLKKEKQLDGKTWALAHWHFNRKEFGKAIDLLWPHHFSTSLFEIQGRSLLLQSYFEALRHDDSYSSLFFDYCEAFKKFVRRDKNLATERKQSYLLFIKYTAKVANLILRKEKEKVVLEQLIKKIDDERVMQGKRWIKEVLGSLINEAI